MEQTGECHIAASRDAVWAALNDPDVLARCLTGCESMERRGEDRFDARIRARVGPVRATFNAELELRDVNPLESYVLSGRAKGGAAGFAQGDAHVKLQDASDSTLLRYTVTAKVGGKLAQVGSRLLQGTARKLADDFFENFQREMANPEDAA